VKVSVVLPTYNERENIGGLIGTLLGILGDAAEIIVVDDNSPDGTSEVVERIAGEERRVKLVRRLHERGLRSAIATGIAHSGGDAIAWMDCDLSMPPEVVPGLLRALETSDIAVGSRYVRGGCDVGHSPLARLFSRAINLMASLFLGVSIRDYTSGFVVARRPVFTDIQLVGDYGEYCIDFLYRARKMGFRVVEVPYRCVPRRHGQSKTGTNAVELMRRGVKYITTIVRLRFSSWGR
jgi:dolichol-phosphate mannosyltransferase